MAPPSFVEPFSFRVNAMRKLFLDANIILDFYRYGSDDLDELQKLVTLIAGDEIKLYTNDHLRNEVKRNREGVVAQMLEELRKHKFKFRSPKICEGHEEVEKISALMKEANTLLSALSQEVEKNAIDLSLRADTFIDEIFAAAQNSSVDDAKFQQADLRRRIGSPPGKPGSLGDGIHWLSLLGHVDKWRSQRRIEVMSMKPKKLSEVLS